MTRLRSAAIAAGAAIAGWGSPAAAGDWDVEAALAAEIRLFPEQPLFADQRRATASPSVVFEPVVRYHWNDGIDRVTAVPFIRYDADDGNRTHADIRELSWRHIGSGWDTLIGVSKVFWGVTESLHLVDIVNQTDLVEDIDTEDKLGQPMAAVNLATEFGRFGAYFLPYFRERTFPDDRARLRGEVPIETDDDALGLAAGRFHPDFALRYARATGSIDLGLAYFRGLSREPRFDIEARGGRPVAVPRYDPIDQGSIDAQYTVGGLLLKLEALVRAGQGRTFFASVAGFEYTFFSVFGSDTDVGMLAEYLYDGRDGDAPPTPFEDDVFAGLRVGFNDAQDAQLLVGAIVDRTDGGTWVSLEFERRLGTMWKMEAELRALTGVGRSDPAAGLRRDDHLKLRLVRFF